MYSNIPPISHNIPRVMEVLDLCRAKVYDEINAGRLRTYKVGRRRMVSHEALLEYIRAREAETQGAVA